MAKATRSLSGASQKKYFRDLFNATEGVTPDAAATLVAACTGEIAQIRVRLPIPDRGGKGKAARAAGNGGKPAARPDSAATAADAADRTAGFDPFAFSVVVAVTKEGRAGLAGRLAAIASADDLKALAKAQHVALPEGELTLDELRAAIVDGALQRVANRKAAAS